MVLQLTTRLLIHAVFLLLITLFFFIWAIYNTIKDHFFDLGLGCFPFTLLTSLYGIYLFYFPKSSSIHLLYYSRCLILSYSLTIIAYLISVCLTPLTRITYFGYCIIAIFLWGVHGRYYYLDIIQLYTGRNEPIQEPFRDSTM